MEDIEHITHFEFWDSYYDLLELKELTLSQLEIRGYFAIEESL